MLRRLPLTRSGLLRVTATVRLNTAINFPRGLEHTQTNGLRYLTAANRVLVCPSRPLKEPVAAAAKRGSQGIRDSTSIKLNPLTFRKDLEGLGPWKGRFTGIEP